MCEGRSCVSSARCWGHQCFASVTLSGSTRLYLKGCFRVYEQGRMTCRTPPSAGQVVECCQGHLCNHNISVELPIQSKILKATGSLAPSLDDSLSKVESLTDEGWNKCVSVEGSMSIKPYWDTLSSLMTYHALLLCIKSSHSAK